MCRVRRYTSTARQIAVCRAVRATACPAVAHPPAFRWVRSSPQDCCGSSLGESSSRLSTLRGAMTAVGVHLMDHMIEFGLAVPESELLDVSGLPVLAVKRYDRQDSAAGDIPARVHQEDGCQASATPPVPAC